MGRTRRVATRLVAKDWFAKQNHTLNSVNFDIFYTAGRRKKTAEGFDAKKAREILLYRTKMGLEEFT